MMKAKKLSGMFWGEAVNCAVYLLNMTISRGIGGKAPYELWTGSKPSASHLRTFGCVVFANNTKSNLKKLDRGKKMVFVGYEPRSAAYRCYDLESKRVHISRDVIFDEEASWEWSSIVGATDESEFSIEGEIESILVVVTEAKLQDTPGCESAEKLGQAAGGAPEYQADQGFLGTPISTLRAPDDGGVDRDTHEVEGHLDTPASCNLDADHNDAPLRFRKMNDILGSGSPPGRAVRDVPGQLFMATEELSSFSQAEKDASWRHAMAEEINSIEDNNTLDLVNLPAGYKPIGLKWVYKLKKNVSGVVVKYKARLVAKGHVQREGVDFEEVFAPVARLNSLRLLLALAAQEGWLVHHLDVKFAFLNGDLKEEVYVMQPPGFVKGEQQHKVYRLRKAMYGLKQAKGLEH
jgi:hypothetical protein